MKTLAKYYVCNHCVIGEKTFEKKLIGPGKLPGLSRNGPQLPVGLIAQFGRGLRRYRRGHGFESRSSLNFFSGLIFVTA